MNIFRITTIAVVVTTTAILASSAKAENRYQVRVAKHQKTYTPNVHHNNTYKVRDTKIRDTYKVRQNYKVANNYKVHNRTVRVHVQPEVYPAPVVQPRPTLGIYGSPTNYRGIHGVKVVQDYDRLDLRLRLPCGSYQTAHFRAGYDIITEVNGRHVDCNNDVSSALSWGWNRIKVYDSYTGQWSKVKTYIPRQAVGNPVYYNGLTP